MHNTPNGIDKYLNVVDKDGWTGNVSYDSSELAKPYKWKKPRRIFVCSMGDLFHKNVRNIHVDFVVNAAAENPQHTFIILTKRAKNMQCYFNGTGLIPDNVWLGFSASTQTEFESGMKEMANINHYPKFVSLEPLIQRVYIDDYVEDIDWVIVGGETGPGARIIHSNWVSQIQVSCGMHGIPFFFKQWGVNLIYNEKNHGDIVIGWAGTKRELGDGTVHIKVANKNLTGRKLNGREYNEYPGGGER